MTVQRIAFIMLAGVALYAGRVLVYAWLDERDYQRLLHGSSHRRSRLTL